MLNDELSFARQYMAEVFTMKSAIELSSRLQSLGLDCWLRPNLCCVRHRLSPGEVPRLSTVEGPRRNSPGASALALSASDCALKENLRGEVLQRGGWKFSCCSSSAHKAVDGGIIKVNLDDEAAKFDFLGAALGSAGSRESPHWP